MMHKLRKGVIDKGDETWERCTREALREWHQGSKGTEDDGKKQAKE